MNIRTTWTKDGVEYLIRTKYDDVFRKFVTDYYVGNKETGKVDEKGLVECWTTSENEEKARQAHVVYVTRFMI